MIEEAVQQLLLILIPSMGVFAGSFMLVHSQLKAQVKELGIENKELREMLRGERDKFDEINRKFKNLSDDFERFKNTHIELESKYTAEIELRKYFQNQADKNNDMLIAANEKYTVEREKRVNVEAELERERNLRIKAQDSLSKAHDEIKVLTDQIKEQ